jgi:hypothetical protein
MPSEEAEWEYPFSQEQVEAWKASHGNIYVLDDLLDEPVVIRGMDRDEYYSQTLSAKTPEQEDEEMALKILLYPEMSQSDLREADAGLATQVHTKFRDVCHGIPEDNEMIEPAELPKDLAELPEEVQEVVEAHIENGDFSMKDVQSWAKRTKSKLYIDYIDDQLFIYHGLRRKDYDLFRDQQREGKFEFRGAEEEICRLGIEYPMKKDFDPSSKTFVYGMASLLSILVMKASGFNKQVSVKKL